MLNITKTKKNIFLAVILVIFCAFFTYFQKNSSQFIDEIIVKFKNIPETVTVKIESKNDYENIIAYLNENQLIEYHEPNYKYKASIIPSDTYYQNQWHLKRIKAFEAWDIIRESPGIIIAIIDSGVQVNHPDLKDNIWVNTKEIINNNIDDDKNGFIDDINGWDFVNENSDPSPKFSEGYTEDGVFHGTIIAGIAAASGNNAAGVAGVTWKTKIMPLKALDDKGEGSTNKVVKAIDYAIKNGADIINLSFVGFGYSRSLEEAIRRAYDAGIIVVAAAGNDEVQGSGHNLDITPMYPACNDGSENENMVIGVGATDGIDQKAPFSSYGNKCLDISAPGISVFSTIVYSPDKSYDGKIFNKYYDGYWSGTSMATPIISATAALIEQINPKLSNEEVIAVLTSKADDVNLLNPKYSGRLGKGRVNVFNSVSYAKYLLDNNVTKLVYAQNSSGSATTSQIYISDIEGKNKIFFEPFLGYKKGLNIVSSDFNDDGVDEIAVAKNSEGSVVKFFSSKGVFIKQFSTYGNNFNSGVNLASGDVNKDGKKELIVAPAGNGGPHIKVFNFKGQIISQFFAYANNFYGGVYIASGDVDGDGYSEIITGPGKSGGPQVRVFQYNGKLQSQFFAYDKNFRGGVRVTSADMSTGAQGNKWKIITAPGIGGGPHIRIFNSDGKVEGQFFAYSQNFKGGVFVSSGDLNNDGFDEIVTGAGQTGTSHIKTFSSKGILLGSFFGFEEKYLGGVSIATINY